MPRRRKAIIRNERESRYDPGEFSCPVCGDDHLYEPMNYCPNCGAELVWKLDEATRLGNAEKDDDDA